MLLGLRLLIVPSFKEAHLAVEEASVSFLCVVTFLLSNPFTFP